MIRFTSLSRGVNHVEFSDVVITENDNVICSRTSDTLRCFTPQGEGGSIDLSGYIKVAGSSVEPIYVPLYVCLDDPGGTSTLSVQTLSSDGINNSARINWTDMTDVSGIIISIEDTLCP